MAQLRSVGQRQRDADAHNRILDSVKELSQLLHLPESLVTAIEESRHRDAFMQMMLQREAIADALEAVVLAVKNEPQEEDDDSLPEHFPGRNALIAEGFETLEDLKGLSRDDLIAIDGIGAATADKILSALSEETDEVSA